ncbi:glutamine--fructose-6-phosphate transaminase (isomerizing) [Latilactobacillus curvatus]|uniref:glutamine--fructose-6-phosphate transaminase (isomerizing) n=1 Tax=Latilactobacillus curvatus TaxID=28038 RepID=UPI0020744374|nr:glutamine--fructose-6-phosphate transaminase (isomerizing) [Latilactobacillus curvatus]MCM6844068.1 glutamine--fructose-6-phosphate transaminase (isomerizing) [Latilactobacillus curvatus]MCM6861045.1 glutamine--fructose-6-phosphate transaminase (isomerizing) [Latilactobacillus curvatus]MCM6868343.1 glutamine--fructose-6-phosphate transaminase (isomerizing) [Latilactobacillus curvatus]MDG2982642.1 glutamine--fructose-6-phosphate transaminase (isomerizing) [Latilactobacillus curvatus]
MCGIVGVIGNEKTTEILLNGLEKLAYRGYDSAGIYVNSETGRDYLVKEPGKISVLEAAVGPEVQGTIGVGHTRWATHGVASRDNAHPHVSEDGRFYLVHNGVLTNYLALKETYLEDVHFVSQTDTEVAVQLIAYLAKAEQLSAKEAFRKALTLIEGSYAFVMVDRDDPDTLYVAKNKSPLLIGVGDGFNVVCSDALAMLNETKDFIEIHDREMVTLTKQSVQIEDLDGTFIHRESYHVEMDADAAGKGTYPHYMLKEIDEQPAVMRRLLNEYVAADGELKIDSALLSAMNDADRLYIVAAGTSYHAGLIGKTLFETLTHKPVEVHVASEFGYHMPLLSEKPFFIFLTQSGETADSRQVLVQTNALHYPSLTITNSQGSTLSREADYTLLLHAGPEIAVASTKAYTAQIAVELFLAVALGRHNQLVLAEQFDVHHELGLVATGMEALLSEKEQIETLTTDYLQTTRNAFYIGRGEDYALSLEAALKLKEISYIQAEGFAAGELKHGTIALIEEGTPVIAFLMDAKTIAHTRGNLQEVTARGAKALTIVSEESAEADDQIILPNVNDLLTPLLGIIPGQLIAYYASLHRGYDVDQPRNLAKSVTVE